MHRLHTILTFLLLLLLLQANAQTISSRTQKITVDFRDNVPAQIQLLKPEFATTRGFKKVEKENVLVEAMIQDEDGVQVVFLNNEIIQIDTLGLFSRVLTLEKGENKLTFRVVDNENEETEESFVIELDLKDEVETTGGSYYGLIIAINEYDDPSIVDLDNPIKDATALHKLLIEEYSFTPGNNSLLINPTRADIIDGLDALSQKITPNDNLLIFYAGHGHWDQDAEIGYWLPKDAKKERKSAWVRNSTLRDYIKAIDTKHTLLIADACFSGAIFKTRAAFDDASVAINKLYEMKSRKAMTSGTLTEVPDKSAFMKYLLKRLEENQEKYLSSEQLFFSFKQAVINNSIIEDAIPQFGTVHSAGDEGGDFVFIRSDETN